MTEEDKQKDKEEASKVKEEKKKQRTYYNFTDTCVSLEASTPVEPEEGKTVDCDLSTLVYRSTISRILFQVFCNICLAGSDVVVQPITTDFWPPAMSSAIPRIIGLLDDSSVTLSQTAGELNF